MKQVNQGKIFFGLSLLLALGLGLSCTRSLTVTPTLLVANTPTSTGTPTSTKTGTPTATASATNTPAVTSTFSSTFTITATPTDTQTQTPSSTATPTATDTSNITSTFTDTFTITATATDTFTPSTTATATATATPTSTYTATATATPTVYVYTLAGTQGTFGYGDGSPGSFRNPFGVAVDSSGVPYIADQNYGLIRDITPGGALTGGTVTTLAGGQGGAPPNTGYADAPAGPGTAALFKNPSGLVLDPSGNIYVADSTNNVIRLITPAGHVTTFAGSGTGTFANGTGTAASFFAPNGICINSAGTTLYVADTANQRIRAISVPGAVVTTIAGSGAIGSANLNGTSATFSNPLGVAVDNSGNLYIADSGSNMIRMIDTSANVTTLAGQTASGYKDATGVTAKFSSPYAISIDLPTGNLYVADFNNQDIRKVTSAGVVTTYAGPTNAGAHLTGFADGPGASATFNFPTGVAVYSGVSPIIVYVADKSNQLIRAIQ